MHLKGRCSRRYCLLLALLVLGQEFNVILANSAVQMKEGLRTTKNNERKFEDSESNDEEEPNVKYEETEQNHHNEKQNEVALSDLKKDEKTEKRGIHGVLFAASIATSLINLGLDILLKVKGCSIFYPSIKRNTNRYNVLAKIVAQQIRLMNADWKRVEKLRDWVKLANDKNAEMWIELKRIGDLQDRIVKTLDPDIIKQFNLKANTIKQMVTKGNNSVINMSYKEFDTLFQSSFTTVEDTSLRLAPITGLLGVAIAKFSFKHYKLAKMQKTLRTGYGSKLAKAGPKAGKFFGYSKTSMKLHLKQTSKSMYKAKFSGAKMARFMRVAGSVMSVVSIAMDIYSIIKKIKACRSIRNRARDGVRKIRQAYHKTVAMRRKLDNYEKQLHRRGVYFVKKQLTSNDLRVILISMKDLSAGASQKARDLRSAAPVISRFLAQIKRASNSRIYTLQVQLVGALRKVTVFLECYHNKVRMAKYIRNYCRLGVESVSVLYRKAIRLYNFNLATCQSKNGFPYTTLGSVKTMLVDFAKTKWFNMDCVLNSRSKRKHACVLKHKQLTPQNIASQMKLTLSQVQHFLKFCGKRPFTPALKKQICAFRSFCAPEEKIASNIGISAKRLLKIPCLCSELVK